MNPRTPFRLRRFVRWLLAGLLAGAVLLGVAAASLLTLSRDASWLRTALRDSQKDGTWTTAFQGDAGPVLLGALRWGLRYHEGLEPELRGALAAVRRASVGVYRIDSSATEAELSGVFPEARAGWTRLIAVRDARDAVVVYVREPSEGARTLSVAVAIREPGQVVVVAGEIEPEHLLPLIPVRS